MAPDAKETFPGFPDFRANVTFVPIQFFTVVVPHCSRGTVRIVGYALRKVLGWVDEQGNPTREQLRFTYRQLMAKAGVSRDAIASALAEARDKKFLRCVKAPRPDRSGKPSQSGVYEIWWDKAGRYTNRPEEFNGFFYPEAAVMEESDGSRAGPRPKSARKNIPNAFFDYLLPRERLSVIRSVGALMFYSIQWGNGGERKVPVSRSITELSQLTKLSRRHTHDAVMEAQERGYIEQVDPGFFDPAAGRESRPATYAIRWTAADAANLTPEMRSVNKSPIGKSDRDFERSEKVHGPPVRKGARHQSEKVNGKRSEKVNDISIKRKLKNMKTTATGNGDKNGQSHDAAAAGSGFALLCRVGFDVKSASSLAATHSREVIAQQIQWLALRAPARNRLGLLRSAIEGNWPKPEITESAGSFTAHARLFASHYYASYHGYTGEAGTEPFPKDIELAAKFIPRLLAVTPGEPLIPSWGKRLGRLMKAKHHGDPRAKPNLSFALVLYADEFLRLLQSETAALQKKALGEAKEAHYKVFLADYLHYLKAAEISLQQDNAGLYEEFTAERDHVRKLMSSGPFMTQGDRLLQFDDEVNRLLDFADFFEKRPGKSVLNFWEWDARLNPQGLKPESKLAASPPEHRA